MPVEECAERWGCVGPGTRSAGSHQQQIATFVLKGFIF